MIIDTNTVKDILNIPFKKRDIQISDLASFIDHTNLNPAATEKELIQLCDEYVEHKFASICIHPVNVPFCRQYLGKKAVITTVTGFPTGQHTLVVKQKETKEALNNGADEFDMVINIAKLKEKNYEYVRDEISKLKDTVGEKILKVIIEDCLLTNEEKVIATMICIDAGADFVKTSTGFSKSGATINDVNLLYNAAQNKIKVKAAGGIRDYRIAIEMIKAGADRIGASQSTNIIKGV